MSIIGLLGCSESPLIVVDEVRGTTLRRQRGTRYDSPKLIVDSEVRVSTPLKLIVDSEVRVSTPPKLIVSEVSEVK